jgi:WD40 repeat protein
MLAPVALGFSADGKRLASIDASAAAHVWDPRTGVHRQRFAPPPPGDEHHYYPFAAPTLVFTPGGGVHAGGQSGNVWCTRDALSSLNMVHQVDLPTGARVRCHGSHQTPIGSFTIAADGKPLAGTSGERLHLWDLDTGGQRSTFVWREGAPKEQIDRVGWQPAPALALAPDGQSVATGAFRLVANSKGVTALAVWETATGKVQLEALAAGSPEHRVTLAAREASARLRLRPCR